MADLLSKFQNAYGSSSESDSEKEDKSTSAKVTNGSLNKKEISNGGSSVTSLMNNLVRP